MNKTEATAETLENKNISSEKEQQLANDLQLISMIRESPDFLKRHPELLSVIEVPHESGRAISLIERQVAVLREQARQQEQRLCNLMDVARDNERLAQTRHKLALNLLSARDLDEVVSIVLDTLRNDLSADYAVVKLFSDNAEQLERSAGLFARRDDDALKHFKTLLEQKNTLCGNASDEQKAFLFADNAAEIKSAAIIPLVAGANLGLIGLGAASSARFRSSMGTEFLSQTGELISAALAVHMEG
ncbi:MAG TPA: DUF484 family protein [Gammaproteobacteria bacterium]|nr:DUF484 family protein [Gammaproteobacteria bacterium]